MKKHLLSVLLLTGLLVLPLFTAHAQTRIDPKSPDWQWFPIVDTMYGIQQGPGRGTQFGREIHSVGDVSGDGIMDFVVNQLRADTMFTIPTDPPVQLPAEELLLFRGAKGKKPSELVGERIGLTEIGANVKFLAAGDFDGDHHRDIIVQIQIIGDTRFGNTNGDYDIYSTIVFWNNGSGQFSLRDTTRLQITGIESWYNCEAVSTDWTNDGADDLMLWSCYDGYKYGQVLVKIPRLCIWQGRLGQRWGRNGLMSTPDKTWWTPPPFNTVSDVAVDQDGDGNADVGLFHNMFGTPGTARLTILYGRKEQLPDTNDFETITLDGAGGFNSILSDVTGDGLPEILVDCGGLDMVRIYAGRRRQRLKDQFGSGNDDPTSGKGWWRRPWAELWSAGKLNDGWTGSGFSPPFAYDGSLDSVNDIWLASHPYFLCYTAGYRLDSLIDGLIEVPQASAIGYLGDVDGSGVNSIAVRDDAVGGVIFFKATKAIGETYIYRKVPDDIASADDANTRLGAHDALRMHTVPNPTSGEIKIIWQSDSETAAIVKIQDILGREVATLNAPARQQEISWQSGDVVGGAYFITVTIGKQSDSTRIIVR
jgi:hypothetical protein